MTRNSTLFLLSLLSLLGGSTLLAQAVPAEGAAPAAPAAAAQEAPTWLWIVFTVIVSTVIGLDVFVFNRRAHQKSIREAVSWVIVCTLLALFFNLAVFLVCGSKAGTEFLAGYLIELNLSVDNLFVFLVIFGFFGVTAELQPRVLAWGILGAIVLRLVFIYLGIALVERFSVFFYVFGAILIYTGLKLLFHDEENIDPEKQWVVRLARRFLPMTKEFHGQKFFVRESTTGPDGALTSARLRATPLFLVLLVIETTDVVFAVDSVPAIIGVTQNRFVAFTSNVFAILGLRAIFFVLTAFLDKFHYLKVGLSFVLIFIGVKMILEKLGWGHIPPYIALIVVVVILAVAVAASLFIPPKAKPLPEDQGGKGSGNKA